MPPGVPMDPDMDFDDEGRRKLRPDEDDDNEDALRDALAKGGNFGLNIPMTPMSTQIDEDAKDQ